jgi:SAM-dependent methyltransferase
LGQWVVLFDHRGYHGIGLDISQATISRLCGALPDHDWRVGNVTDLGFESETLDAIASWGVIEHFEELPAKVLAEFRRVLKPGGWLFVTVPFLNWRRRLQLRGRQDNRHTFGPGEPHCFYQYVFTGNELRECVEGAGFVLRRITPTGRKDGIARWIGLDGNKAAAIWQRALVFALSKLAPPSAFGSMIMAVGQKLPAE